MHNFNLSKIEAEINNPVGPNLGHVFDLKCNLNCLVRFISVIQEI